jgi:hypothetical protein
MKRVITILFICLLPFSAYCLSNRDAYELLSLKSKEIKQFPFHVYIAYDYGEFKGVSLPISMYDFFQPYYEELSFKQTDEIFATYQFPQGTRWECFLLRHPNVYASNGISIWVFDREQNYWQEPIKIAEWWGDAGYSIDVQAWVEDLNRDGWFDIVIRTLEKDINLEDPETTTRETIKKKDSIFVWDKDHFKDESREYLPKMKLDQYRFKEHEY